MNIVKYLLIGSLLVGCTKSKETNLLPLLFTDSPPPGEYSLFPTVGTVIGIVSTDKMILESDAVTIDEREPIVAKATRNDWCGEGGFVFLSCNYYNFQTPSGDVKLTKQGIDRWFVFKKSLFYSEKKK